MYLVYSVYSILGPLYRQKTQSIQGKKLFFHFTRPLDEYFPDFGCPNIKSTRPKNDDNEPLLLISYSKWRRHVDVIIRDARAHGRHGSEEWRQRSIDRRSEKKFFYGFVRVDLWAIFLEDSMVLKYCKWKKN